MFFWISRGISEPYVPPVRPEIVPPLHSVSASAPPKKPDGKEEKPSPESGSSSRRYTEVDFLYKHNASLGNVRSKTGESLSALTAKDLSTAPVLTFSESDPVERAEEIFFKKRFRHVPVVDDKSLLCGILSDRDWMFWKLNSEGQTVSANKIGDVMKTRVLSVHSNAGIGEIAKVLFEEKIGCLPVVSEERRVIGIVTRSDVLRGILKVNEREFLA
ncbi:CBS domain-containing protein [Leptospira gomenensis]|uniref:CBS domain-containing protein n=1 Tax=Leptospira gomenensis TaxID=2484974 RepID=A0A5F1YKC1_9LEPT|nr:CBS domain-containing protein [Leptospira gomenensis]TGK33329.1 CBS domain-containing protein [Leptospira gomenensis]TGK37376.1 CBS domain-containing protein [Leptospira gomenensis]TGK40565.1 CBS domain-containing protein [Leptospira gomenensis]TGK56487.1 CBS domain-containing protein [Leptospira gomenensis]